MMMGKKASARIELFTILQDDQVDYRFVSRLKRIPLPATTLAPSLAFQYRDSKENTSDFWKLEAQLATRHQLLKRTLLFGLQTRVGLKNVKSGDQTIDLITGVTYHQKLFKRKFVIDLSANFQWSNEKLTNGEDPDEENKTSRFYGNLDFTYNLSSSLQLSLGYLPVFHFKTENDVSNKAETFQSHGLNFSVTTLY